MATEQEIEFHRYHKLYLDGANVALRNIVEVSHLFSMHDLEKLDESFAKMIWTWLFPAALKRPEIKTEIVTQDGFP